VGPDVKLLERVVSSICCDIKGIIRRKTQHLHAATEPADVRKRWAQDITQFASLLGLYMCRRHIPEVARDQMIDKN
jgi:hypothetical protein